MGIGDAFRWLREERGLTAKEVKERVDAAFAADAKKPPGNFQGWFYTCGREIGA